MIARRGLEGLTVRREYARGQLVEAYGYRLAQVHGGLMGIGGDFDEQMAVRKIFAGKTALFRAKDEGYSPASGDFLLDERSERGQLDDRLLGFAASEGPGAGDQGAIGDGLVECLCLGCGLEQIGSADGGAGFAPVRRVRRDDGEVGEAEVGHGPRGGADVERVARRD